MSRFKCYIFLIFNNGGFVVLNFLVYETELNISQHYRYVAFLKQELALRRTVNECLESKPTNSTHKFSFPIFTFHP